jgi:heme a synthase
MQLSTKSTASPLRPKTASLSLKNQVGLILGRFRNLSAVSATGPTLPAAARLESASRFPDSSSNAVAYWLLGSAASVFGIVVFGGLTRLTESGYVVNRDIFPRLRG